MFLNGSLAAFLLRFGDKGGEGDPAEREPRCWPPSRQPGRRKQRPRSVPPPKQIETGRKTMLGENQGGLAAGVAAADGLLVSRRVSIGISSFSAPCPDKTLLSGSLKTSSSTPQLCASWVLREAGGMKGEEELLPSFQQPSRLPWACWKDLA